MNAHFSKLKLAVLLIVTGLALSACQTTSMSGQGELSLHNQTLNALTNAYLKESYPLAFAVPADGSGYSYSTCSGPKCRNPSNNMNRAIENCQRATKKPCHILALRKDVVWKKPNGTPYSLAELQGKRPSSITNSSNLALCQEALAADGFAWSDAPAKKAYVDEVKNRGMEPAFCAKLTGQGG